MNRGRLLDVQDASAWDAWLATLDASNVRQLSGYGSILARHGQQGEILVTEDAGSFSAGALLGVRRNLPMLGATVHTSGGIGLADPGDATRLDAFLEALLDRCREIGTSCVDVYLGVPQLIGDTEQPVARRFEEALNERGFRVREPFNTYRVRLAGRSDEELLQSFHTHFRKKVRKAGRDGVVVELAKAREDFVEFEATHLAMCREKGLVPSPAGMFSESLFALATADFADLFVARFKGVARNYLLVSKVGIPVYVWGAVTAAAWEKGCPTTGPSLHYDAMCRFKAEGHAEYDLGGSPGPVPVEGHPNHWVWKFKYDFGGTYVSLLGWWRRDLRPVRTSMLDGLRRVVALKRKFMGR